MTNSVITVKKTEFSLQWTCYPQKNVLYEKYSLKPERNADFYLFFFFKQMCFISANFGL